jgi:hypothetical protein
MIQLLRSFLLSSPHYQIFKKALEHPVAPTISSRPLKTSRLPGEDHQQRWHAAGKVHALPPNPLTQLLTLHPANLPKFLFTHGAYINWLTLLAMCLYGIVTLRCVNSKLLVRLYLAAISPSPGSVVRIGYSGVCIQMP